MIINKKYLFLYVRFLVAILMVFFVVFPVEMTECEAFSWEMSLICESDDPVEDDCVVLRSARPSIKRFFSSKRIPGPGRTKVSDAPVPAAQGQNLHTERFIHEICSLRL